MIAQPRVRHRWQQELGPFLSLSEIAEALLLHREQVLDLVVGRNLLSLRDDDGTQIFPTSAFEIVDGASCPIEELTLVLDALALGQDEPWMWALWLSGSLTKHGGWSASEALVSGDRELVLERARNEDWSWMAEY